MFRPAIPIRSERNHHRSYRGAGQEMNSGRESQRGWQANPERLYGAAGLTLWHTFTSLVLERGAVFLKFVTN